MAVTKRTRQQQVIANLRYNPPPRPVSFCYVVGWESLAAVKVGIATSHSRIARWASMRDGHVMHLEQYDSDHGGCLRECQIAADMAAEWHPRWSHKHKIDGALGCRTDGWTEFYAAPIAAWSTLSDLILDTRPPNCGVLI